MNEKEKNFSTYESEDSVFIPPVESDDGDIKSYAISDVCEYPYLMLRSKTKVPKYRMSVLKDALEKPKYGETKVPDGYLNVYLNVYDNDMWNVIFIGLLNRTHLRAILSGDLFADFDKAIQMDEDTRLKGSMMYTVCSFAQY